MNRHNFFGHLALAIAAVMLAAFMGQMRRMGDGPVRGTFVKREILEQVEPHAGPEIEAADAEDAEVIVRFRAGISTDEIERLTARLNDRLEDRFEFINNEAVIADEDDLSAEAVAAEYSALPEVLYAEPNYEINLSPVEDEEFLEAEGGDDGDEDDPPVIKKGRRPNDQMFAEQWSLTNEGQRGGKAQADISAALAWEKTTGSEKIVVVSSTPALITRTAISSTTSGHARTEWPRTRMSISARSMIGTVTTPPTTTAIRWTTTATAHTAPASSARKATTAKASPASTGKSRSCR